MAETLGQAVLEVGVDDSRLRAGLRGVEQQAAAAGRAIGQSLGGGNTLSALNDRLAEVRRRLDNVEIGSKAFRELQREARQLETDLERAQGRTDRLGGALDTIRNALATFGAVQAFRGLINAATELENITRKLSNTLGDQGAQQALGFTRELSDRLGLSFTVLSDSFAGFTAAASAANIPLSEQQGLFAAVSTSAQRLGLSNDAINGSLLALQQVAAKGTVQMEELRGQLGERLPTAFAATARGLGITSKELIKLVESGQLTADQFFPALTKGLNELNGGGAGGVPTATQNFASLANVLKGLQADFGTEFLPGVVGATQKLAEFLQGFTASQKAADLSAAFGFNPAEAQQLLGQLDFVEKKFGLTREQSRNITSDALKLISDSRGEFEPLLNSFGQLTLTGDEYAKVLGIIEERSKAFTAETRAAAKALQDKIALDRASELAANRELLQRKAERSTVSPAREELRFAQRLSGLEGERLRQAKQLLDIEKLRRLEREKQAKFIELGGNAAVAKGDEKAISAEAELEAAGINVRTEIVKGADELRKSGREIAKQFNSAALGFQSATRGLQSALESRANATAAASDIASQGAIAEDRGVLLDDIRSNLATGRIDQRRLAQRFGLGFNPNAGGFVTGLERLDINRLSDISRTTSPLADTQRAVIDSQRELLFAQQDLAKATAELKAVQEQLVLRESNLAVTVAPGETRRLFLP